MVDVRVGLDAVRIPCGYSGVQNKMVMVMWMMMRLVMTMIMMIL